MHSCTVASLSKLSLRNTQAKPLANIYHRPTFPRVSHTCNWLCPSACTQTSEVFSQTLEAFQDGICLHILLEYPPGNVITILRCCVFLNMCVVYWTIFLMLLLYFVPSSLGCMVAKRARSAIIPIEGGQLRYFVYSVPFWRGVLALFKLTIFTTDKNALCSKIKK